MNTISVAVIAKNEAENIARMTKSLEGLFDQYVLVDTGSTDGTQELAKKLGWEVHHFDWVDDFSAARNFAFSKATSDFIFWCDLDDVLDNPEGFKNWKEVVMPLYDFHLANYHYALDPEGKPIITFARERVFRREKNLKWDYPIHEGITTKTDRGHVAANFTNAWSIKHMRTGDDLAKDKNRNLEIFKKLKDNGKMCVRMKYYYGKEMFEAGDPFSAIPVLEEALVDPKLEAHDRLLGMQYLCFSHMAACDKLKDDAHTDKQKHLTQVIKHATSGLVIAPNRAEFFVMIGDAHLKLGRIEDALPFYRAATECNPMAGGMVASPVFHHKESYGVYPLTQIAQIYAHPAVGNLEKAKAVAREAFDKYGNEQARNLLQGINQALDQSTAYKMAKPCDDIVFTTPPQHAYPFDPKMMEQRACGGSETAGIWMALCLAKVSGKKVKWFMQRPDRQEIDGVEYIPNTELPGYFAKHKPYLHIAWRHNIKITDAPTFVWSHDLMTPGAEVTANYEKIMCLTPWHKKHMMATQGIPEEKIWVTRNGLDPDKFIPAHIEEKDPYLFVFGSSPDRGLDNAMLVLDKVRAHFPVKLRIHYGWSHIDQYGLKDLRLKLEQMVKERPWVEYVGSTKQEDLMASYREASYNVQPSAWLETSCISALELVLNGVYPIFRKVGGVSDTLQPFVEKGMASLIDADFSKPEHIDVYAEEVIKAITEERYKRLDVDVSPLSWESVAKEWLEALPKFAYNQ